MMIRMWALVYAQLYLVYPELGPATGQFGQDSDAKTGGAFRGRQEVFVRPGGASDVQVYPGHMVRNELLQKDAADNGPC